MHTSLSSKHLLLGAATMALVACSGGDTAVNTNTPTETDVPVADAPNEAADVAETVERATALTMDEILVAQPDQMKARYEYRNPKATLEYFAIEPGMTIAEVLPGGGWYSKIILPYLGDEGTLIGIDYNLDMWSKFGGFATDEFLEKRKDWTQTWAAGAMDWRNGTQADVTAFRFGSMPSDMKGTVDRVLLFRATHHLNRWNAEHWDEALADMKALLKPDGMVGIVQHRAPEASSDSWASGDSGYLKQSYVIAKFEEAGFKLAKDPSEINANPKDQPTSEDVVWRLPPTLGINKDDPEFKAKMEAIGESDRMTLLFQLSE